MAIDSGMTSPQRSPSHYWQRASVLNPNYSGTSKNIHLCGRPLSPNCGHIEHCAGESGEV